MVTDNQRREVAKRLRELPTDMYGAIVEWEKGGLFIDKNISDEADYSQIHNAVFGCFPAEHMNMGDYEELHDRLADLIEPEPELTCKVTYEYSGKQFPHCIHVKELSCGHEFRYYEPSHVPNYCPECGARVVS